MHHNESPRPVEYRMSYHTAAGASTTIVQSMSAVLEVAYKYGLVYIDLQARRPCGPPTGNFSRTPYRAWSEIPNLHISIDMLRLILSCKEEVPVQ